MDIDIIIGDLFDRFNGGVRSVFYKTYPFRFWLKNSLTPFPAPSQQFSIDSGGIISIIHLIIDWIVFFQIKMVKTKMEKKNLHHLNYQYQDWVFVPMLKRLTELN